MQGEVSTARLYLLRFVYIFTAVVVGVGAWPQVIRHSGEPGDLIGGIAFSIYAAYSLLMLLGVLIPLRMLPLVLLQLLYKLIWIAGIGVPQWRSGHFDAVGSTLEFFAGIVVLDLIAIPWPYVLNHYVRAVGKREKARTVSV
jgi:hypothetical protein